MDYGGGAGKLTPDTRPLSWRRSSTQTTTSHEEEESKWLTNFASQRDKSKFGFKTGEWNSRKKSKQSRNWTSKKKLPKLRKLQPSQLNSNVKDRHQTPPNIKTFTLLKVKFKLNVTRAKKLWWKTRVWWISRVKMLSLPWEGKTHTKCATFVDWKIQKEKGCACRIKTNY